MKGIGFDGSVIFVHMAECAEIATDELTSFFNGCIKDGLSSENAKYWKRIRKEGAVPTAVELLDFIYDKFEINIEGGI